MFTEKSPMAERRQTEIEGRWLLRGAPKHRIVPRLRQDPPVTAVRYIKMYLMRSVL